MSKNFKKDSLGNRMKENYENVTKFYLPKRTYIIIRLDGKAFHSYTRGLEKPFDDDFIDDMNQTVVYLCENIQGAQFAYVQSDEISILVTDFENINTRMWFNGNIQKIVSVSASYATAKFNSLRYDRYPNFKKLAHFDARVFTIPERTEVENYFIWRQQDCVRNSISSLAQSLYSPKELHGKNQSEQQELCFQKGINWDKLCAFKKRGRLIVKIEEGNDRGKWGLVKPPIFSQFRNIFDILIPKYN